MIIFKETLLVGLGLNSLKGLKGVRMIILPSLKKVTRPGS